MSAQHIEKWPEFDDHPSYGKRLAFGNDAVILNRSQYSHAKLCVDACEGITDKDLHALKGTNILQKANHSVDEMQQQNAELLAACISAKNTMLASVDNSYAMADTIELLESTIAKAGRMQ